MSYLQRNDSSLGIRSCVSAKAIRLWARRFFLCRSAFPKHQTLNEGRSPVSPSRGSGGAGEGIEVPPGKGHWQGIGCMRHLELHRTWEASKHNRMLSVLVFLPLCAAAGAARAQTPLVGPPQSTKGTIQGVVTVLSQQVEPSPLEGVSVELRESSQDSQPRATLTDSAGHYEFTQLPGATYALHTIHKGFKPFAQTISLNANQSAVVDIALTLDTVVEKVEVKEQAASVSTENSSPASTVSNAQLETFPLAQRKFRDALPLVPGVIRGL